MFCPNRDCPDFVATGRAGEYVTGITVCPQCGAQLVTDLAPPPKVSVGQYEFTELAPVFKTHQFAEIQVVQSILQGE